jgi:hypothetical protein
VPVLLRINCRSSEGSKASKHSTAKGKAMKVYALMINSISDEVNDLPEINSRPYIFSSPEKALEYVNKQLASYGLAPVTNIEEAELPYSKYLPKYWLKELELDQPNEKEPLR